MTTIRDYIRDAMLDAAGLQAKIDEDLIDAQEMQDEIQDIEDTYTQKINDLLERVIDL